MKVEGKPFKDYKPGDTISRICGNAPGAYPEGTRVRKSWCEPGDAHAMGTMATVLGSIKVPEAMSYLKTVYLYAVLFDGDQVPCHLASAKITEVQNE